MKATKRTKKATKKKGAPLRMSVTLAIPSDAPGLVLLLSMGFDPSNMAPELRAAFEDELREQLQREFFTDGSSVTVESVELRGAPERRSK